MNEVANSTFIYLTDVSYDYGLITRKIYHHRFANLYALNGLDPVDYYLIDAHEYDSSIDDNYNIENNNAFREFNLSELGLTDALQINKEVYSKDNVLYFISGQQGKYCKWKFNEYDVDDKPSIPHGHGIEQRNLKLDPYRSLIYNINKGFDRAISREKVDFICYLWNNNDFRNLATLAIKYHITNLNKHPLYWKDYRGLLNSPFRLPRRRR